MTGFEHPIREGDAPSRQGRRAFKSLVVVHRRHRHLNDSHIGHELCDPTLTGYYQYYADDVDMLLEDTDLTNVELKPVMADKIQVLYREFHEHSWMDAQDKDNGEIKNYCIHCRTFRDERSRGE